MNWSLSFVMPILIQLRQFEIVSLLFDPIKLPMSRIEDEKLSFLNLNWWSKYFNLLRYVASESKQFEILTVKNVYEGLKKTGSLVVLRLAVRLSLKRLDKSSTPI